MAQQPQYQDPFVHQRQQPAADPQYMQQGQYGQQYATPQAQQGFGDHSGGGHPPPMVPQEQSAMSGQGVFSPQIGQQILENPMAMNMAMQYGNTLANTGKDYVDKNLNRWLSVDKLKYYFSVNTSCVARKLLLVLFPYTHTNWSVHYTQSERATPRVDINAPDLYIPAMGFVTFVLTIGLVLGAQNRFSPEQLGVAASSTLVWLIVEVLAYMLSLYLLGVNSEASTFDLVAFCGYKYVGMIISLLAGAFLGSLAYYVTFFYCSISLAFFLVRTLRLLLLPQVAGNDGIAHGNKRRNYLLLMIAVLQPIIMFWMTASLATYTVPTVPTVKPPLQQNIPRMHMNDPIP